MKKSFTVFFLGTLSLFGASPEVQNYIDSLRIEASKADPAFKGFDAARGEAIFTSTHTGKRGEKVSCTSCHNNDLTSTGKNVVTGKVIEPLAPSVNAKRLSSVKDVKKWLRRNFKDVYNREGTPLEQGDVLTYINTK